MSSKTITHVGIQLLLILLLHTSTVLLARGSGTVQTHESGAEHSVRQLEHERVQALLTGNTAFIERNYADDYMTTGASGLVRKKAEVIADMKSGAIKWESMTHEDVRLRIYGNTAIVTGIDSIRGVDRGQDSTGQRRFTRVWVKLNGRWQLVANHTTRIS